MEAGSTCVVGYMTDGTGLGRATLKSSSRSKIESKWLCANAKQSLCPSVPWPIRQDPSNHSILNLRFHTQLYACINQRSVGADGSFLIAHRSPSHSLKYSPHTGRPYSLHREVAGRTRAIASSEPVRTNRVPIRVSRTPRSSMSPRSRLQQPGLMVAPLRDVSGHPARTVPAPRA